MKVPFRLLSVFGLSVLVAACGGGTAGLAASTPASSAAPASGSAASPAAATSGSWTIAVVGPYTGNLAQVGASFKNAAQLYADQQNPKGGWSGKKIQLDFVDEGNSDASSGATAAQKVVTDSNLLAAVGHFSSSSALAAGPIYKQAQMPVLITTASSPTVTQQNNEWLFRTGTTAVYEAQIAGELMKKLGSKKVSIVYNNTDFGKAQDQYISQAAKANGATVVSEDGYQPGAQDYSAIISKLKQAAPDFVWMGMYDTEAGPFVKQAKDAGLKATLSGSGAMVTATFIKLAGPAAEGVIGNNQPADANPTPEMSAFLKAYQDAYKQSADNFAQLMYSDLQIFGQSVEAGGTTHQALRDKMASIKNFNDISQIASFSPDTRDGLIAHKIVSIVKNGQWVEYATF